MFREYAEDIVSFCHLLGNTPWAISPQARTFLEAVQRGYPRVGLTAAPDCWRAVAGACLWNACCHPDRLQLVMAGAGRSGAMWIRFLKQICGDSPRLIREHLLFTADESMVMVPLSDEPAIFVLEAGHLIGASKILGGRPTVLVMPDLERVETASLGALKSFITEPGDQWLVALPPRK
jgi:hypothetical protein